MFNLFPKKKSVDEIVKDVDITPAWAWQPTQTPSMLQAQNELIGELIKKNNKLTDDYNALINKGGLKYMEAKLQIVQNDYKKCAEQRDEYKHQLNAANKEIEELKNKLRDYQDQYANSFSYTDMNNLQKQLDAANKVIETLKSSYPLHCDGYSDSMSSIPKSISYEFKNEKSWEQAASELALRVAKLEEQLKPKKPEFLNCACGDCHDKTENYNQELEDNNPLYKHH